MSNSHKKIVASIKDQPAKGTRTSISGAMPSPTMPENRNLTHAASQACAANDTQNRLELLSPTQIRNLPTVPWVIKGIFPAQGFASIFGPSGSGKSFLALGLGAAIAGGQDTWFGHRVTTGPVIMCVLEGEAGFKLRVQAYEQKNGPLPENFQVVLDQISLTSPQDVVDLGAICPIGSVVIIDTLNRAASGIDENSSRDIGKVIEASKHLQNLIKGLVILVHHTGKDTSKGLRGHSSLFAALDAAIEISNTGEASEWEVAKAKDAGTGKIYPFTLEVQECGVDSDGAPLTSCVVAYDEANCRDAGTLAPRGKNQQLAMQVISQMLAAAPIDSAGSPVGRRRVKRSDAIKLVATTMSPTNKHRFTRAAEAVDGLIGREILGLHEDWIFPMKK